MTGGYATKGAAPRRVEVAIDTGGTFTDVVARYGVRVVVEKIPSTPEDPSLAVARGLERALARLALDEGVAVSLVHGTTVATNALLASDVAETFFVTNEGFEDLTAIGRQHRRELYAIAPSARAPLVPPSRRVGVGGRLGPRGERVEPLDTGNLERLRPPPGEGPRAWAVCLLHAYANGDDEQAVADLLRRRFPQDTICLSSEVVPVIREVERASTTIANAGVAPLMRRYLGALAERCGPRVHSLDVMGSSGGRLSVSEAIERPVLTSLSGPAGGVVGAALITEALGEGAVVSFDMGGTSTDVALCHKTLPIRQTGTIGPYDVHVPMLDIHTIGAGGGSIAWVDEGGALRVGPRSAGAVPGPACYGASELATVTDANVVLGRMDGTARLGDAIDLQPARSWAAVGAIAAQLNVSTEDAARGIVSVAVESMARAVRKVTTERGVDPRALTICAFGGAGPLHACELAERLGMRRVVVPALAGVLSAAGMAQGVAVAERSRTVLGLSEADIVAVCHELNASASVALGGDVARRSTTVSMRYRGQGHELEVPIEGTVSDAMERFHAIHEARFGYRWSAAVEPVTVHVRVEGPGPDARGGGSEAAIVVENEPQMGPCIVRQPHATLWVANGWSAQYDRRVDGWILTRVDAVVETSPPAALEDASAVAVALYHHRFAGVAEEMGEALMRAAFSPNIRERRDFSCAVFDGSGLMIAQAAHIPVHLGATPLCVRAVLDAHTPQPGETYIVNDPFAGGTHLPDITLVTCVDIPGTCERFFVASRAHHADVGGLTPGSLPLSRHIDEEGWRVAPCLLDDAVVASLLAASRTGDERAGDLAAQRAAATRGARRLRELCATYGSTEVTRFAAELQDYSERAVATALRDLPEGTVTITDVLDDAFGDGVAVPIVVTLSVRHDADGGRIVADFRASADAVSGPMNAVRAIVMSAVLYVMHCVCGPEIPVNSGSMRRAVVLTRPGSVVDARYPSAVAAGNVETSQRIVDVLWAAFAALVPDRMSALSCGSMNNVMIGGAAAPGEGQEAFVIYETIAGGLGGGPDVAGASATQAHMTNTRNTPIESLEHAYPLRILRYGLRHASGGGGLYPGGEGIIRDFQVLEPSIVTLIGERRTSSPTGAAGGHPGQRGAQSLRTPSGVWSALPGKWSGRVEAGSVVRVETPGGGGWGSPGLSHDEA